MGRFFCISAVILFGFTHALQAAAIVEIITVNNRPASELQPLLQTLLEETDHVVANGDSLIVKTTPERLPTITAIVHKLDTPLTNLQITVLQGRDVSAEQLNASLGVDVQSSRSEPGGWGEGSLYGNSISTQDGSQHTQTIKTMDGIPAHIKTGKVVPMTNYQSYHYGFGGPGMSQSTQLVEATTGFEVTPHLVGEQVVLDVSPWSDKFRGQGQIQTQEESTTIRAHLGEWVEIGGVDESAQNTSRGVLSYSRHSTQNNLHILVKVDAVN